MDLFVVISTLSLNGIRGQQYSCLWWTVNLVTQNALLHLQEEKLLGDILDQLLCHILWKELGSELELQWVLLLNILRCHLRRKHSTSKLHLKHVSIKGMVGLIAEDVKNYTRKLMVSNLLA